MYETDTSAETLSAVEALADEMEDEGVAVEFVHDEAANGVEMKWVSERHGAVTLTVCLSYKEVVLEVPSTGAYFWELTFEEMKALVLSEYL